MKNKMNSKKRSIQAASISLNDNDGTSKHSRKIGDICPICNDESDVSSVYNSLDDTDRDNASAEQYERAGHEDDLNMLATIKSDEVKASTSILKNKSLSEPYSITAETRKTFLDFDLTEEQLSILNACPQCYTRSAADSLQKRRKGLLVRVTAGAGSGKTTTLLALALKAIELGHSNITYVTFTKAAANDARERLQRVMNRNKNDHVLIDARTIHSFASSMIREQDKDRYQIDENMFLSDEQVKSWIGKELHNDIERFLTSCYRELASRCSGNKNKSIRIQEYEARKKVVFFIFKSLKHFCISEWSVDEYSGKNSKPPFGRDYYPLVEFHQDKKRDKKCLNMGFKPESYASEIKFYANQVVKLWEKISRKPIRSYDIVAKQAQLYGLEMSGTLLLVDESQDMDACQISWVVKHQSRCFGKVVFVVGDPAQSIYGFRGAKPKHLMELEVDVDCKLTESWRFGSSITQIANLILFCKKNSDQTCLDFKLKPKYWIPYSVRSAMPSKVSVVSNDSIKPDWKLMKITIIARTNTTLMIEALELLGFPLVIESPPDSTPPLDDTSDLSQTSESETMQPISNKFGASCENATQSLLEIPKFYLNGKGESSGKPLWLRTLKLIQHVFDLYKSKEQRILDGNLFPEFTGREVTWETFCEECESYEYSQFNNVINVIQKCSMKTLEAVELFKNCVIEGQYSAEEADVILTTCHSAKGMEWDNVAVCDDFNPLANFKTTRTDANNLWMFGESGFSENINLLYVACTRAKKCLEVPSCVSKVVTVFDEVHVLLNQKKVTNVTYCLPGKQEPSSLAELENFYNSLVKPMRLEWNLKENQHLLSSVFQCRPWSRKGEV